MDELENLFKNIQKEILDRADENRNNVNQALKNFETDITRALEKKANMYEITTLLNNKADSVSTNMAINSRASLADFEHIKVNIEKLNREYINKVDFNKFEAYMGDTRAAIEETQKELVMKANIKEILNLMKNKAEIDDVNKALTQIHDELDHKAGVEQVKA